MHPDQPSMTQSTLYSADSIDFQFARSVVQQLVDAGFVAYFAGGCVRDALLEIQPQDFDIASNARLDDVRHVFGLHQTRAVGEAFGVVLVHGRRSGRKCQVEVATFRTDGVYSDGRRPDWVAFATPEQDAQRRDFTINGLFYDPLSQRVIDFVEGQQDLTDGILRAIGDPSARIEEDKLRMLRAIRFAARFELTLEPKTRDAIARHADSIAVVSGERIGVELKKILEHPSRQWAWDQLLSTGLLPCVLPKDSVHPMETRPQTHPQTRASNHPAPTTDPAKSNPATTEPTRPTEQDWIDGISMLGRLPLTPIDATTALAAWLEPWFERLSHPSLLQPWLLALQRQWKLSNQEIEATRYALLFASPLLSANARPWSMIQPILTHPMARGALMLARAIAMKRGLDPCAIDACQEQMARPAEQWNPAPWITGTELIAAGLKPSPQFAALLAEARRKQLDGEWQSKHDALLWLQSTIPPG
jgi:poly(A) polymerase